MRTASPWWASLLFGIGLISFFIGERLFGHIDAARVFFSFVTGLGFMGGMTALRIWTMVSSSGDRRRIERALVLCHLGTLLALALYATTTAWGHDLLGIKKVERWDGALTVLYAILLLVSAVPVILIETSLGAAMRNRVELDGESDAGLDYIRVRDVSWSGLTIAFATSLLFVTCNVAKERNVSRDVSYFKTSAPGDSTIAMVSASAEPIRVHLFFPEANEVKEQVLTYFEALKSATGKIEVALRDRMADTALATKYKVGKDGVIVLARGDGDKERNFSIELDTDIEKMRRGGASGSKLRNLDREVNSVMAKVIREKRKAYLTAGHGELTNAASLPAELKGLRERGTVLLKRRLGELNYEVKDLASSELIYDVPDDATIVMVVGPAMPLLPAEWDSLGRYFDKGGHLMIALDPTGAQGLGSLEGRLGVRLGTGVLTDDRNYMPMRNHMSDRRVMRTSNFSAHAATTTLSRATGLPFFMIEAGFLEEVPFTSKEPPKRTFIIHSMDTAWADLGGDVSNFQFDGDKGEARKRWPVGVAVEGAKGGEQASRALVFSDSDLFADVLLSDSLGRVRQMMASGPLLDDAVRWLGGEEKYVGEVVSEDDKPVQHTKDQDALWFTITVIGVPLLVLGLGLFGTLSRRRKGGDGESNENENDSEVTP